MVPQLWILPHPKKPQWGKLQNKLQEEMNRLGVKHVKASAYNSSSNGEAEREVRSIKEYLRKENIQKVTQELLQKLTFKVNNHVQNGRTCTVVERFLRRKSKSLLPNSMERDINNTDVLAQ